MTRRLTLVILGTLVLGGCASPQSKAREADEAQHEANEKAAYASEDTKPLLCFINYQQFDQAHLQGGESNQGT